MNRIAQLMETRVRGEWPLAARAVVYALSAPVADATGVEYRYVVGIDGPHGASVFASTIRGEVLRTPEGEAIDLLPELIDLRAQGFNFSAAEGLHQLLCFTIAH